MLFTTDSDYKRVMIRGTVFYDINNIIIELMIKYDSTGIIKTFLILVFVELL